MTAEIKSTYSRVPRKLKKKFKKYWKEMYGYEVLIIRKTIRRGSWQNTHREVWGCEVKQIKR